MAIQFAKLEKCEVIAISRKQKHLDVAKKLGATTTITFDQDQEKFLEELQNKVGLLDAAIVFAPADIVTDTAIQSVKKGGLVVIGTVGKISNFVAFEEKTIRGTLIGSRKDMEEVVRLADKHKLSVVSETYPLEQANEVLEKLKNSEIEARAVLVP
jgi:propanol-preferring alcohol dehydrogenase